MSEEGICFSMCISGKCMKQKLLHVLPVFGQNPDVGQKPLEMQGGKCDVGDFVLFWADLGLDVLSCVRCFAV